MQVQNLTAQTIQMGQEAANAKANAKQASEELSLQPVRSFSKKMEKEM